MPSSCLNRALGAACLAVSLSSFLLGCPDGQHGQADAGELSHTLYVAHDGVLVSYDVATGAERPGEVTQLASPVDMEPLADGTLIMNLTGKNQILAVDGHTMLEVARLPSSASGGTRPVHSYLTPARNGRQFYVALNDGQESNPATNSARFIQALPGAAGFLQPAGEVALGIGHHKASFSNTRDRAVFSNIADCNTVLGVYDYSDPAHIQTVRTWSAAELGWDGSSYAKTCDPTYATGAPPAPHGCATSKLSNKAYCNLTTSGDIVAVALDEATPTIKIIPTNGSGAGYTKAHKDGRYIYSLQESPREGKGGVTCQVGQLVVVDATNDTVAAKVPLLYRGPGCTTAVATTDEESTEPGHILQAGNRLFVGVAGGFGLASARVRQELVLDISNPAAPVQLASVTVGASTGHHADTTSGDGKFVFVVNNVDNTISQIDIATSAVVRTFTVRQAPAALATFGAKEGGSHITGPIE